MDASGTTSYDYDAHGRVTKKSHALTLPSPYGTHTRTVRYQHTDGNPTRLTMPSGTVVDYAYNDIGRVGSVTVTQVGKSPVVVASNTQYDPFDGVKDWTWANGSVVTRQMDLDGTHHRDRQRRHHIADLRQRESHHCRYCGVGSRPVLVDIRI